jgi:peptide/nickel transport system substrate-binding protein
MAVTKVVEPTAAPTKVPEPTKAPAPAVKPVVVAHSNDIDTLDPHLFNAMFTRSVGYWIFDCLVMSDINGKPMPELATEWKRVDPLTWEFKLVKNAKFHNGEVFNASVVKWNFDRMARPEKKTYNAIYQEGGYFKEVKIIDDYTVQLLTTKPSENFLWHLGRTFFVAPKWYTDHDDAFLAKNPVGTGPYKFVEWVKDSKVTVAANPDYFQGAPKIKDLQIRVIPEASSRLNELKVGNVDLVYSLRADQAKQANTDISRLYAFESLRKMHLSIQFGKDGPDAFKKLEVRQAMNYAIDRKAIIDAFMNGGTKPLPGLVNSPNTSPNVKPYEYNVAKAKELMAKAGLANGFQTTIFTQADRYGSDKEICQILKQNLEAIGIKVTLEVIEAGKFVDFVNKKNYPGMLFLGLGTYNVPAFELVTFQTGNVDNLGNYTNPEFDKALEAMTVETDPAKRATLTNKAEEIVYADTPWVYLWRLPFFMGMSNRLVFSPYPDGYIDFWQASLK